MPSSASRGVEWMALVVLLATSAGLAVYLAGKLNRSAAKPAASSSPSSGLTSEDFIKSISVTEKEINRATAQAEARHKERNNQIHLQNSAEAADALRQARAEIEASRGLKSSLYALAWFGGDRALGDAMVDVLVKTLTKEIEAQLDNVKGNEWMFQPGDQLSIARLWPAMKADQRLRAWMQAHQIEEEFDFHWHLLIQTNPDEAARSIMPPDVAGLRPDATGSGFWVSADGHLLTNQHVVAGAKTIDLRLASRALVSATVIREDEKRDLALLKADVKSPEWLALSAGDAPQGVEVFTQGFPNPTVQGLAAKFSDGKISSLSGMNDDERFYQVSLPVQPGNSGGPLIHASKGVPWVVGVVSGKLIGGENVNYAIKATVARQFLGEFPEGKAVLAQTGPPTSTDSPVEFARKAACLVLVKRH